MRPPRKPWDTGNRSRHLKRPMLFFHVISHGNNRQSLFVKSGGMAEERVMKKLVVGCALASAVVTSAYAATTVMTAAPSESWTVTNYYKQAVYDPKESKIGDVDDVLVDKSGKITGLVIGVGGFLGVGEKDVIVPFGFVK